MSKYNGLFLLLLKTFRVQPLVAPPGAPTLGMYVEDRYCGLVTWIVATVGAFPCACFCPCDRRTVWLAGDLKVRFTAIFGDAF